MNRSTKLSFVSRVLICMAISLAINALVGHHLKSSLSQGNYTIDVQTVYPTEGIMHLLYDTGSDFNEDQQVTAKVAQGQSTLHFPFKLNKGEQLKHIRLDFGANTNIEKAVISSLALSNKNKILFSLHKEDIAKKLGLLVSISKVEKATGTFTFDTGKIPFDPYIVFEPMNKLIYPKWQRILLLVLPWFVMFLLPLLRWFKQLKDEGAYGLIFIGLFLAAIPLKIAWVTFTTLLLLGYALFQFYKTRKFHFGPIQISLLLFYAVPVFFLGEGDFSKLAIPMGFVLFALISTLVDFSEQTENIKRMYITVFFILMSVTIVSWLELMLYEGYYYNVGLNNYFADIKTHAHIPMFWLYYPHATFLSFFILIGGLFCLDLYGERQTTKGFGIVYAFFTLCTLLLLGSRFALVLAVVLSFLYTVSIKNLSRWLLPLWVTIFAGVHGFLSLLDPQREQLWRTSWTAITSKFWVGHGTGMSSKVLPEHIMINKGGTDILMEVNHSHNQYLTYLLENGFLGTLMFLAAFFFLFYHYIRQKNKTLLLVCFMVLLLMIIESPFRTTTSLYVIAFLLSLFNKTGKRQFKGVINSRI